VTPQESSPIGFGELRETQADIDAPDTASLARRVEEEQPQPTAERRQQRQRKEVEQPDEREPDAHHAFDRRRISGAARFGRRSRCQQSAVAVSRGGGSAPAGTL
jgi:hypothetical protein